MGSIELRDYWVHYAILSIFRHHCFLGLTTACRCQAVVLHIPLASLRRCAGTFEELSFLCIRPKKPICVLTDFTQRFPEVYLCYPSRRQRPSKLKASMFQLSIDGHGPPPAALPCTQDP
jgi:hypothetical protein